MKVLLSWLRDFVDVPGTAEEIGRKMSLRGLALEGLEPVSTDDAILDFEVTANRPDCLSVVGIAREIATAYGLPLRVPGPDASGVLRTPELRPVKEGEVTVSIEAPDLCARYTAAAVTIVPGPSPAWMQARLRALGVRPISNMVDITNYVMLELGQPMHAFDATTIANATIIVRRASPGERFTTLDGKQRTMDGDMLMIADGARSTGIGGVMGGEHSEVTAGTTDVILEAAWFNPKSVRATSRKLGLRTEASYRFERGADLDATARATARAAALIEIIGAGTAAGTVIDVYPAPFTPTVLTLTSPAISGLLGMDVPDENVERILRSLGFDVRRLGPFVRRADAEASALRTNAPASSAWQVTTPGWRVDIARVQDLVEEVGRHHGFEHLPATFPGVEQAPPPADWRIARDRRARRALLASGLSESVTFAFIEEVACTPFADTARLVRLANPLSEKFAVMRPSLVPGLVDAVSHNRRHEQRDVRLFEIGTRFDTTGEVRSAAFAWTGLATPDHWSVERRDVDFFDAKGVVEHACAALDVTPTFAPARVGYLVDGRAATVHVSGTLVGTVGQLSPAVAAARDLPAEDPVYVAELDLDAISAHAPAGTTRVAPLPRHPSVVRDIAILVDDSLSAESVRGTIRAAAPSALVGVREFDRYQGKGIPDGKVSLALRLTFQRPDRTLTDDEVQAAMDRITTSLRDELGAVQR